MFIARPSRKQFAQKLEVSNIFLDFTAEDSSYVRKTVAIYIQSVAAQTSVERDM